MEDYDAVPPPERVDDPAVGFGVVADVVQRDIRGDGTRAAATDDVHIHEPFEGGEQKRGVVGDA
jgi:hypothetical protein